MTNDHSDSPDKPPAGPDSSPFDVDDLDSGLPDMMFRLMVNRGMEPTLGLRFLALDLANLSVTGRGKFPNDLNPLTASAPEHGRPVAPEHQAHPHDRQRGRRGQHGAGGTAEPCSDCVEHRRRDLHSTVGVRSDEAQRYANCGSASPCACSCHGGDDA